MEFEELILTISSKLDNVSGHKKSIVQADLGYISGDIEECLFKLKISEINYQRQDFSKLKEQNIQTAEAIGLLFLSYLTYTLRTKITYRAMWSIVSEDLLRYEKLTTFFYDKYFVQHYPNLFLKKCIEKACSRFELRNAFNHREEQQILGKSDENLHNL